MLDWDNTSAIDLSKPAHVKASLLAEGIAVPDAFLGAYGPPYLEKRRAYGNNDSEDLLNRVLPQELILSASGLICAVNIRQTSSWVLKWKSDRRPILRHGNYEVEVDFPRRPMFYDYAMKDGRKVSQFVTLYGGGSLGLFIYGRCALVDMNKACHYCSIQPNRGRGTDFEEIIRPEQVEEAVCLALADLGHPVTQVMLNGGNFKDVDKNFLYYCSAVKAAERAIERSGRDVELHLIVYPPHDTSLFDELAGTRACVAMNWELFDETLFQEYCPGKHVVSGHGRMLDAMFEGARRMGRGKVYSIIVGGLESTQGMRIGLKMLADHGVVPVINVFHADPGTPLSSHPTPSADQIVTMGCALQDVYRRHDWMRPFYRDCGRNAIDTEAFRGMF